MSGNQDQTAAEQFTLRNLLADLPQTILDAECAGIAIILAEKGSPRVVRTMTEEHFISLCQVVTSGRAIPERIRQ